MGDLTIKLTKTIGEELGDSPLAERLVEMIRKDIEKAVIEEYNSGWGEGCIMANSVIAEVRR